MEGPAAATAAKARVNTSSLPHTPRWKRRRIIFFLTAELREGRGYTEVNNTGQRFPLPFSLTHACSLRKHTKAQAGNSSGGKEQLTAAETEAVGGIGSSKTWNQKEGKGEVDGMKEGKASIQAAQKNWCNTNNISSSVEGRWKYQEYHDRTAGRRNKNAEKLCNYQRCEEKMVGKNSECQRKRKIREQQHQSHESVEEKYREWQCQFPKDTNDFSTWLFSVSNVRTFTDCKPPPAMNYLAKSLILINKN